MSSRSAESVDRQITNREVCLNTAKDLIMKHRQDERGNPENTFAYIAEYWSTYLKANFDVALPLKPYHASEMMELLKMARSNRNGSNPDNYYDRAGYCACAFEMRVQNAPMEVSHG